MRGQHDFSQRFLLARRTFYLGADEIRSLRRRIDDLASAESTAAGGDAPQPKPVSTFVALAALSWTAFVRSKGLGAGDDTYLAFLADLRSRLDPRVSEAYLGNCVRACLASCADVRRRRADEEWPALEVAGDEGTPIRRGGTPDPVRQDGAGAGGRRGGLR